MARLPDYTSLGVRDPNSVRGIPTFDGRDYQAEAQRKLGAAFSNAGAVGLDFAKQGQADDLKLAEAKAEAAFVTRHTAIVTEQGDNPDAKTYAQQSQEALNAAASTIPEGQSRELWLARQAGTLARGGASVQGLVDKRQTDSALAAIIRDEDTALRTIAAQPEGPDKAKLLNSIGVQWDAAAKAGRITEIQADSYKRAFSKRAALTELDGVAPEERLAALQGAPAGRDGIIDRITGVESGGVATAKNFNSSATGLGQFIESTWLSTVRGHRPDLMKGRSEAQVLALRNDPALSREMTGYLVDDNSKALGDAKLPVTPGTIYLSHFLGSGGAAAVLKAPPGTPVSDVLESDQIGANRSILAGKTVDTVRAWADRKMGAVASAPYANILDPETRRNVLIKTQAEIERDERRAQVEQRAQSAVLSTRIGDDLASVERTGIGIPDLKGEDISQAFGHEALTAWQDSRARAFRVHSALDGIEALPEGDVEKRLQTLEPKPGAFGYVDDMKTLQGARKKADALIAARNSDPALAVDALPVVREARAAAVYEGEGDARQIKPESAQAVVKARLTAQRQLDIREPLAVTRGEASVIARQLRNIGDDDEVGLQKFMGQLRRTYGDLADEVLSSTIQHQNIRRDLAVTSTEVLGKLEKGQLPGPEDRRRLERASNGQQLDDALNGRMKPKPAETPEMQGAATGKDLQALYQNRTDPAVMTEFDATYGAGTAKRTIAEIERRLGTGTAR